MAAVLGGIVDGIPLTLLKEWRVAARGHARHAHRLLMLAGAVCEHFSGIETAGKSLESISAPLQSKT